jgi:hypothetical protein
MKSYLNNNYLQSENDNIVISAIMEIFEQISSYNEICYQTIQVALFSALEKLKNKENREALARAIEHLQKTLDKCRTASDKIDRLSKSGCLLTTQIQVEKQTERF